MYLAKDIAILIINWCAHYGISVSNLKLQKLLYFLQGEYSRIANSRFIRDDFYAWQLGPVIPSVYIRYAMYSSAPIPSTSNAAINISPEEALIVDSILRKYAKKTAWNLVEISHEQDPWRFNYEIFGDKSIIPYESIRRYFEEGASS